MFKIILTIFACLIFQSSIGHLDAGHWDEYYQNTINETKPHYTLLLASKYFEQEDAAIGLAVDLGTGTGRDALFLLEKGWHVFAVDAEPLSIEILLNRAQEKQLERLVVNVSPFSEMVLPDQVNLINASFSLPFNSPEEFPLCWQNIVEHLSVGGRFAGQLFGDKDEWTSDPTLTFHTQEQVRELFKDNFEIEYLQIEEGKLPTASGAMKHWHIFHVVAKKIK